MKTCSECKNEYPVLWKAKTRDHGALCKDCWQSYKSGETSLKKSKNSLKRKAINPISDKRSKELAEYRKLRDVYMIDRKSTRLNSSHVAISYAVFCLKKKTI